MVAVLAGGPLDEPAGSPPGFVCPFCETTFDARRRTCTGCGGNLVVPVDDRDVYEIILPMCGSRCEVR